MLTNGFDRAVDGVPRSRGGHAGDQHDLRQHRAHSPRSRSRGCRTAPRSGRRPRTARPSAQHFGAREQRDRAAPADRPAVSPSRRKCRWKCPVMKLFRAPMKCSTSITGRLVAMAARVAKVTESDRCDDHERQHADADDHGHTRHRAHTLDEAAMVVEASRSAPARPERLRNCARSGTAPDAIRTTMMRGIGRSSRCKPVPSHGSSSRPASSLE